MASLTVVIPCYAPNSSLIGLLKDIDKDPDFGRLVNQTKTVTQDFLEVIEIILVADGTSAHKTTTALLADWAPKNLKIVRLTRNFGQHPATIAGIASSRGDFVATLDEDGAHNPTDIHKMFHKLCSIEADCIYGVPARGTSHGWFRQLVSSSAKWLTRVVSGQKSISQYQSFRLIRGEIARGALVFAARGVFLDVALSWVSQGSDAIPVSYRGQHRRKTSYNLFRLFDHFASLFFSASTGILRLYTLLGSIVLLASSAFSAWLSYLWVSGRYFPENWLPLAITSFFSGLIMMGIGVLSEYLSRVFEFTSGRPMYVISDRESELRRPPTTRDEHR